MELNKEIRDYENVLELLEDLDLENALKDKKKHGDLR